MPTITETAPLGISGRNLRRLEILRQSVSGPFSVQDAAEALDFNPTQAHRFLSYLAGRGWLNRHRRGLYSIARHHHAPHDRGDWDSRTIIGKLFGPDSYIGGWTACEHWELTDQIFRDVLVMTSAAVRHRMEEVNGFTYHVKTRKPENIFGIDTVQNGVGPLRISDPTRTLVDVLDEPALGGGIRHVGVVAETYFRSDHADEDLLVEYIERLGNRTVFKRLGHLAEVFSVGTPDLLTHCKERMSVGMNLLDPSLPASGLRARRWNLQLNGHVAPDPYF